MLRVTFEFKSPEELIVALGKIYDLGGRPAKADPAAAAGAAALPDPSETGLGGNVAPAAAPTRTRKPRADKGQRREPYGPRTKDAKGEGASAPADTASPTTSGPVVEAASAAAPQAVPSPAAFQMPDAPTPSEPPSAEAVGKALEALFNAKQEAVGPAQATEICVQALSRFGVTRGRDLRPEHRAAFIAHAAAVQAGEQP